MTSLTSLQYLTTVRDHYSVYDAKAHLSAIIRQVREGRSITITLHGNPVAEIRPIEATTANLESRMAALAERGILLPPDRPAALPTRTVRRQGALQRFIDDRD